MSRKIWARPAWNELACTIGPKQLGIQPMHLLFYGFFLFGLLNWVLENSFFDSYRGYSIFLICCNQLTMKMKHKMFLVSYYLYGSKLSNSFAAPNRYQSQIPYFIMQSGKYHSVCLIHSPRMLKNQKNKQLLFQIIIRKPLGKNAVNLGSKSLSWISSKKGSIGSGFLLLWDLKLSPSRFIERKIK